LARIKFGNEADRLLVKQANLYRLQEQVDNLILSAGMGAHFVLTPELVFSLHRTAMDRLLTNPGEYRQYDVGITHSTHQPPPWQHVPPLMADFYEYINEQWNKKDLVVLSAQTMWRINWIHPFENGNGRTARAVSYLVLCAKYGGLLPAKNSVIQQIITNKLPYYEAHHICDAEFERTQDLSCTYELETLIANLLKEQLKASLV
jgi:Fic family protein